jgi:rubrerythrin
MIDSMREFLAHAVQLEANAAAGYEVLAERMRALGNDEVAALFARLGEFSQLHLAETEARYREATGEAPTIDPSGFRWPDGDSPENPAALAADAGTRTREAILMALGLERQACDFYSGVANQTRDAAVQELAQAFTEEESGHVDHLERWLARLDQGELRGR